MSFWENLFKCDDIKNPKQNTKKEESVVHPLDEIKTLETKKEQENTARIKKFLHDVLNEPLVLVLVRGSNDKIILIKESCSGGIFGRSISSCHQDYSIFEFSKENLTFEEMGIFNIHYDRTNKKIKRSIYTSHYSGTDQYDIEKLSSFQRIYKSELRDFYKTLPEEKIRKWDESLEKGIVEFITSAQSLFNDEYFEIIRQLNENRYSKIGDYVIKTERDESLDSIYSNFHSVFYNHYFIDTKYEIYNQFMSDSYILKFYIILNNIKTVEKITESEFTKYGHIIDKHNIGEIQRYYDIYDELIENVFDKYYKVNSKLVEYNENELSEIKTYDDFENFIKLLQVYKFESIPINDINHIKDIMVNPLFKERLKYHINKK